MFLSEQDIRYRITCALACVSGVEIAAADMGVDDHILRRIGDHTVVNVLIGFLDFDQTLSGGSIKGMACFCKDRLRDVKFTCCLSDGSCFRYSYHVF